MAIKGKALAPGVVEAIKMAYQADPNKSKIARAFGVSLSTVYKTLGKTDPEVQRELRVERMGAIADKMTLKVDELMNGLVIPKDASLSQRGVLIGILTDKIEKIDRRLAESKQEDAIEASPLPATVEALAAAIRNEMRAFGALLQLDPMARQLTRDVREVEVVTGASLIPAEGEVVSIEYLDGR